MMGSYDVKDIVCYEVNKNFLCHKCADMYENDITEDSIITEDDIEKSEVIFCDECKEKVW